MSAFRAKTGDMANGTDTFGSMMEPDANAAIEDRVLLLRSSTDFALLNPGPFKFAKVLIDDFEPNRSHGCFIFLC